MRVIENHCGAFGYAYTYAGRITCLALNLYEPKACLISAMRVRIPPYACQHMPMVLDLCPNKA